MFGAHLSIAGGMHNALKNARRLDMDCVQVFTKNQRQWRVPPLTDEQVQLWQEHRRETGLEHVISHDSYLINLASPKPEARRKSLDLFRAEMLRCDALDIPFLVTHPGAHMGEGEEAGLKRVAQGLDELHEELPDLALVTCLETTAGQGTSLGHSFEHLAWLIEHVQQDHRLGLCLDTAHLLAAGYDLTSAQGAQDVLDELDEQIGLERVRVVHVNDSKIERGRRVDRHEHIGHGHVSLDAFEVFVNHPVLRDVPKILETAKEDHPSGRSWDEVNLDTLRGLVREPAQREV